MYAFSSSICCALLVFINLTAERPAELEIMNSLKNVKDV